jgi:hypothetical protein
MDSSPSLFVLYNYFSLDCTFFYDRDSVTRFSTEGFFHESVSPKPLSIPLGPFQNFSKLCRDICSSKCTIDTGGKCNKSSIIKVLIILFGELWEVELTYRYSFAFKFTLRSQQLEIVPIIWHRRQICCRCRWDAGGKFPPVSSGKFDAGINNT